MATVAASVGNADVWGVLLLLRLSWQHVCLHVCLIVNITIKCLQKHMAKLAQLWSRLWEPGTQEHLALSILFFSA